MTCGACPACATASDLRAHRDAAYPDWSRKRATLNFAAIVADRNCPAWEPASEEDAE